MSGLDSLGVKFATAAVERFFEAAVTPMITNDNYEGELSAGGVDRMKITTYGAVNIGSYTKRTDMTRQTPTDSEASFLLDQQKYFYFDIDSIEKFETYIANPESELNKNGMGAMWETIDTFTLGLYVDTAAGQWDGTSYTTGTVTVDVTTGAVTGSGTTFTAAMATSALPFKASGHTAWYRVKTYSSATAIVIEDDKDDETSAYTGGAIGSGATYEIQCNTAVQVTKSNFYARTLALRGFLNAAKIPKMDRWLVVPSWVGVLALQAPELIPAVASAYEDVVLNGLLGKVAGFKVYENEEIAGNSVSGSHILAGHKSAIVFALAFKESGVEDIPKQFGKAYKTLYVYGGKVVDERRKALAHGFWKA